MYELPVFFSDARAIFTKGGRKVADGDHIMGPIKVRNYTYIHTYIYIYM